MQIYLPIAEMAVQIETILSLGAVVGFFSGLFGIGGGFLTTPFLIFLGIPAAVAVGTQSTQLCATSASGVMAHWRKRNVDIRMAVVMIIGGMIGTILGSVLFLALSRLGYIDVVIAVLYVLFLCGTGGMMMQESIKSFLPRAQNSDDKPPLIQRNKFFFNLPYKMRFEQSKLYISALIPGAIGLMAGLMVSVLGIGAGFLIVPIMIYMIGMPPLMVAGTALLQLLVTSAFAAVMHATTNQTLDLVLALLLIIGGVIGTQFGVRAARIIKGRTARILLAVIILGVGLRLAADLIIVPLDLYSLESMR